MTTNPTWRQRLRQAVDSDPRKHFFIAEQAGISPSTLSHVLNGRTEPHFETVVRIARVVGVQVGWLLDEPPAPLSPEDAATIRRGLSVLRELVTR
jgi:transcriptional regulator with XRE-family HTH domain